MIRKAVHVTSRRLKFQVSSLDMKIWKVVCVCLPNMLDTIYDALHFGADG